MGKIEQAQAVLRFLQLPPAQQNEMSALTLLVLAQLSEDVPWSQARRQSLRIHDMRVEILGSVLDRTDQIVCEAQVLANLLHT